MEYLKCFFCDKRHNKCTGSADGKCDEYNLPLLEDSMFFKEDNDAQDVRFIIEEGEKSYVKDLSEFEEIRKQGESSNMDKVEGSVKMPLYPYNLHIIYTGSTKKTRDEKLVIREMILDIYVTSNIESTSNYSNNIALYLTKKLYQSNPPSVATAPTPGSLHKNASMSLPRCSTLVKVQTTSTNQWESPPALDHDNEATSQDVHNDQDQEYYTNLLTLSLR
ncbi:hypothetical protein PNOK_0843400 [Pyrrhoderma noxium]|uniref:Uncharacterized protein n=1 Tax=Pyrrhoderma noxium TaxID=2282107 RepID=A0A286U7M3_9AGAM|nr:hypothetical protein PNOK_0843400 [Pyrrhoderma noxium]